jgi:hypothetical protein
MTKEQIQTSLDAMLENPKAKNFLNHLVRSYFPIANVEKVWETPKGDFKCVLTRDKLFSVRDILEGVKTPEAKNELVDFLKVSLEERPNKENASTKLINDGKLGVTGKDTTTFMSYPAFQEFYDWVVTKAFKGDKHISWLLGSIRRGTLVKRAETIQDSDVQMKVSEYMKLNKTKVATFTLGESSDFLTKLKADLEASGN